MRVKIGDFGLPALAGSDPCFRLSSEPEYWYRSPEMESLLKGDPSVSRFSVDIWALGCTAHELLTLTTPFTKLREYILFLGGGEFPRNALLSKRISHQGIEFIKNTVSLKPEDRMTAKEALDSDWLQTVL